MLDAVRNLCGAAIAPFGRQAPEVVSLLLLQLYAPKPSVTYRTTGPSAARAADADLMDVKLEGEVSLPWLSRDPSTDSELLRAERPAFSIGRCHG